MEAIHRHSGTNILVAYPNADPALSGGGVPGRPEPAELSNQDTRGYSAGTAGEVWS